MESSAKWDKYKIALLTFFYLVFLILLGVQVRDQVSKFLRGATTTSRRTQRRDDGLQFPRVSFCPGFRGRTAYDLRWPLSEWVNYTFDHRLLHDEDAIASYPNSEAEANELVHDWSFDIDDTILNVTLMVSENMTTLEMAREENVDLGQVVAVNTLRGRCFSVVVKRKHTALTFVS